MSGGTLRCRHCGAEFADDRERSWHWFTDHSSDELADEERHAAITEDVDRREEHELTVSVSVPIPREAWQYVCERQGVDPESTSPAEIEDGLIDLIHPEFGYQVGRAGEGDRQ